MTVMIVNYHEDDDHDDSDQYDSYDAKDDDDSDYDSNDGDDKYTHPQHISAIWVMKRRHPRIFFI